MLLTLVQCLSDIVTQSGNYKSVISISEYKIFSEIRLNRPFVTLTGVTVSIAAFLTITEKHCIMVLFEHNLLICLVMGNNNNNE